MVSRSSDRIVFVDGWGDVIGKAAPAFEQLRTAGYKLIARDIVEDPRALRTIQPDDLLIRGRESHERQFDKLALSRRGFEAAYIANPGDQHIGSALELQRFSKRILVSKPLDTNLNFLTMIHSNQLRFESFTELLAKLYIHDHYLNKPGVEFLTGLMPTLHARHNFLRRIKMFLVERNSIEFDEAGRREGLRCGLLFDLGVHLLSMLDRLVPNLMRWTDVTSRSYERLGRKIFVKACSTATDYGSTLGKSTVVFGREAETFGMLELEVQEEFMMHGSEVKDVSTFPVLITVGKGVPIHKGAARDLKSIVLEFKDGAEITLDLDTHQFSGIDAGTLSERAYDQLDLTQRGINKPLLELATSGFGDQFPQQAFQNWSPALSCVEHLFRALHQHSGEPVGYGPTDCQGLMNQLFQQNPNFSRWNLPNDFETLIFGMPPSGCIA